ncbi:MAG: hypothetical protein IPM32_01930 [Ignavibacteriae bacterium]|nr:hypothetical protein [Ignavibacteriota bacterium]
MISLFGQIKIHKKITTSDGLINGFVRNIFEDSKGFVWFSTNAGVSKWDGKIFENFTELNGLSSSAVFDITEDNHSKIYFANFGKNGITTFYNGKFDTIFADRNQKLEFVTVVHKAKNNSIFFGAADGIHILANNTLVNLNKLFEIPASSYHDIKENSKGEIFIATRNGLLKYSNQNLEILYGYENNQNEFINTIGIDNYDNIYFTDENKFWIINQNGLSEVNKSLNYLADKISDIYFDENNIGYFATDLGLGIFNSLTKEIHFLTKINGLPNDKLLFIWALKNKSLLISSAVSGVLIYQPNKLENFFSDKSDAKNILNILVSKNGNQFINTDENLLLQTENNTVRLENKNSFGYEHFVTLLENNNKIYLGTSAGIDFYENGKIKNLLKFDQVRNVMHNQSNAVFTLAAFDDSTIYAGTYKGVFKIVNDKSTLINQKNGLLSSFVSKILVTKNKSIIYGYHGKGLSIYNNGDFKHYSTENGLSHNTVTDLCEIDNDKIIIATQHNGLNILSDEIIDSITVKDGLLSNEIRAVKKDNLRNIYVTTPNGLNIIRFEKGEINIRNITKEDGLAGNDCNPSSLFVDDENNVWIGTTSGLSKYNPTADKINSTPPKIFITGFEIFNKPFSLEFLQINQELNYDQNYLKFIYAGIDIPNTHKLIYQYRLIGVDKDWVTSKENSVQYTSLDNGIYNFEIKAKNEWGYWSEPASLAFVINPAWWETWWFYTLTIVLIGSLIAFIASFRYRQLLAVEKLRTKISADLHDSIGSGLSEITILSGLLKTNKNVNDLQNGLKNISVTARSLVGNMSDIVWLVNPAKDSLKDLLLRLQDSYQEVFAQANISFNINGIENIEEIHLPLTYRQHLFLLFKEAINNSLKYSECSKIELTIIVKGKNLSIHYQENGKGFDLKSKDEKGNGLTNMKNRAKAINGNCEIISEINRGTVIKFNGKI